MKNKHPERLEVLDWPRCLKEEGNANYLFQTSVQLRTDLFCLVPLVVATSEIQIQLIQQSFKSFFPASFFQAALGLIQLA